MAIPLSPNAEFILRTCLRDTLANEFANGIIPDPDIVAGVREAAQALGWTFEGIILEAEDHHVIKIRGRI